MQINNKIGVLYGIKVNFIHLGDSSFILVFDNNVLSALFEKLFKVNKNLNQKENVTDLQIF
jgi:hypothetical protein